MRKWLKGIGITSIIVGSIAFIAFIGKSMETFEVGGTENLAPAYFGFLVLLGSIIVGIFWFAFAEVLGRLEAIEKNTDGLLNATGKGG